MNEIVVDNAYSCFLYCGGEKYIDLAMGSGTHLLGHQFFDIPFEILNNGIILNGRHLISKYKEILTNIYNGSCSSCYTYLPAQALVDAKKGMELIECPSCSIFLYFDEDR